MKVPISKIVITGDNPRKEFDIEKIHQVGESLLRHGQIHSVIIRPLSEGKYELVTGEIRVRGAMAVGLEEIEADIRELSDIECKILRLIENVHRSDLSDAEKGDAIIELKELEDKSYKEIAEKELCVPYNSVTKWISKSNRISDKLRQVAVYGNLAQMVIDSLLKYSHVVQDQLADFIMSWNQKNPKNEIISTNIRNFCKEYDQDQNQNLDDLAKKITGFVPVTVWKPKSEKKSKSKPTPKSKKKVLLDSERCMALTSKGKRCSSRRLPNSEYCSRHVHVTRSSKPKPQKKPPMTEKEKPKLPKGEFNVIYADPPWRYEFSKSDSRSIEVHYSSMSLEKIKAFVFTSKEFSISKDAILFLWATSPKLQEALEVMKAWGFEYRTSMIWIKPTIGMGYYIRERHELILIGKKGNMSPPEPPNRPDSIFESPRQKHSQKPHKVYELIERMYPDGKYLELFARHKRPNWTTEEGIEEIDS